MTWKKSLFFVARLEILATQTCVNVKKDFQKSTVSFEAHAARLKCAGWRVQINVCW